MSISNDDEYSDETFPLCDKCSQSTNIYFKQEEKNETNYYTKIHVRFSKNEKHLDFTIDGDIYDLHDCLSTILDKIHFGDNMQDLFD